MNPIQSIGPRGGQAALAMVFLVGGIIVVVGITLAFLAISFINSSFGFQSANRALALASSGVADALVRLTRNFQFSDAVGYCVPEGGTVPCPSGAATVTIVPVANLPGQNLITSVASVGSNSRKIEVVVGINATTTQVSVLSWRLAPL